MSLRVAFVMPGLGLVERGAEVFVLELGRALAQRPDIEVTFVSRARSPARWLEPRERLELISIAALPRHSRLLNRIYGATRLGRKALDTFFLDPLNLEWSSAAFSALPKLWRGRFDVAVIEAGIAGGWVGRLLRRFRSTAFVDIAHGNSPKWEGAFARQRPDRVVAFTRAAAAMIAERAPRAEIEVIPHGVDLELFRPTTPRADVGLQSPVVMTAGAVDEQKRLDLTVEALGRLGRGSLLVLGEGPGAGALDRLGEASLGPGRYLRRVAPRSEMPSWYAASDVFTLPSESESFGLVYLEAMACGVPCVAPDDPVRREVLSDAAVFADVCDAQAYAAALDRALDREWGELPRRRAEEFPVERTIADYESLLRGLVTR